ncbi:MAG: GMC oxidoreductase [Thiolinea sp.]
MRSTPEQTAPDLQLYFNAITYDMSGKPQHGKLLNPHPYPAFSLSFDTCRPESRGEISIRSPDPLQAPAIRPNYLSAEQDIQTALAGCRLLRRLAAAPALASLIESELSPGVQVQDDAALLEDFRARVGTIYHPCGTCRMGPTRSRPWWMPG